MARPEKIKTPLGQRLTDIRKALGYETRPPFAELLGLPLETLGGYERGIREPEVAFFATYYRRFGVNLTWLLTGDGNMFEKERPVAGKAAMMLNGFEKLPDDLQEDLLAILRIDLKRAGLL